jgi:Domain of unknown function (DUF4314)
MNIITTSLVGKRIRLISTNDPFTKLRAGAIGKVTDVRDDLWGARIICVAWENGSTLSLVEGEDDFIIVAEPARHDFADALERFVQSTLELSLAWESLDSEFASFLNTLDWGFTSSLDEWVHELGHLRHQVLDAIRANSV